MQDEICIAYMSRKMDVDVFILGAGPAGCCAALNLAPFYHTLMIDRLSIPRSRAGESLPPVANRLLSDMGLFEDFKEQGHLPYYANQSCWGSEELREVDFLRDPMGHGWHLDRQAFEIWLRKEAVTRGAALIAPAQLAHVEWDPQQCWKIVILQDGLRQSVRARVLIDAGGRTPVLARRLGAARVQMDRIVCGWVIVQAGSGHDRQGISYIHSVPEGWWYTAPTPGGKRIVAFHTSAGHAATAWMHSAASLLEQARKLPALWERIDFEIMNREPGQLLHGYTAANTAITQPAVGSGWLTVGDAAMSFDPLSSQGIFNALYTGLAASESTYRFLRGEIPNFAGYQEQVETIQNAYQMHLQEWYRLEKRWSDEDFWRGRPVVKSGN